MKYLTLLLLLLPFLGSGTAWFAKGNRGKLLRLLLGVAILHLLMTFAVILLPESGSDSFFPEWITLQDSIGRFFLLVTSLLFCFVAIHTVCWLPAEALALETRERPDGLLPLHIFVSALLAFLGTMTLVIEAQNFGLLWVAVEATTLTSAPLILFHRSGRSLEAMWKYLLICSVGIGLALFGTMLLAASCGGMYDLGFAVLLHHREQLAPGWFKAAFIFIAAGYGTKMGLSPFHTWLPDAHSEAPGSVSALLSGALLNCSFLGILRYLVIAPETLHAFCSQLLLALGLVSLFTAACFILRQSDFKRMLAYSSVEQMGLLALMAAALPLASPVWQLHALTHSLLKMTLFLLAGNFLLATGTRQIPRLGGLWNRLPRNSVLWLFAVLLISGVPPSPLFLTELLLLAALPTAVGAAVLILLLAIFLGMTWNVLKMLMGPDGETLPEPQTGEAAERLIKVPLAALLLIGAGGALLLFLVLGQGGFR